MITPPPGEAVAPAARPDANPDADPSVGAVGFARALRAAGVGGGVDSTAAYLRALAEIDAADRRQVYWAGRATLCSSPGDMPYYDLAFAAWFGGAAPAARPSGSRTRTARTAVLASGGQDSRSESAQRGDALRVAASDTEALRHRDIADLTAEERAHLAELIAGLRAAPPTRRALRMRPGHRGTADPRATLQRMIAAGGEPVRPSLHHRARTPRRVVLLIDVSGSMSPYADALLRFAHVVCHRGRNDTEVFSVGTRMTRLTTALRARDPEIALAACGRTVPDWASGTRLGETMRAFLARHGRRGMARGATVVMFSDGWERGDTGLLGEQMAQLRRLAHAVFWVNPHAGAAGYEPVQSGIAAAAPHIDRLLAGHSVATLQQLLTEVRDA